ncbi:bacteriohemerythrin [Imhoffiella purpurea]|uniref:Methyl-accepting chemotaxis protein n=1 Tax=Imhoffiella purpurea TaxID=1249627 RepID=W9V6V0_9GAMM|nr:bacteriohemerythrin [Imhoffiella purpurea]EXJ12631.1 Methyl-accepting chemotaxis protein [Imhoffiella purpurea]
MAKFVEWSDALSVGIEEIDAQHRVLVELVNEMHDAIQEHHASEAIHGILDKLAEYTRIHFAVEESLMRILDYPDYEVHKHQHEELIRTLRDLQDKVASGKTAVGFELMHFLKLWLTKHIIESDKEYGSYFLASGVRPRLKKKSWVARLWDGLHG